MKYNKKFKIPDPIAPAAAFALNAGECIPMGLNNELVPRVK